MQDRIAQDLVAALRDSRGVQAEGMLISVGALTGRAAALAVYDWCVRAGGAPVQAVFTATQTKGGTVAWFSDSVNRLLFEDAPGGHTLWSVLRDFGREIGAELPDDLPARWAAHYAKTLGGSDEGKPLVPADAYAGELKPADAVSRLWPRVRERLKAEGLDVFQRYGRLAALTAGLVSGVQHNVDVELGVTIAMQAAMAAAKLPIDPAREPKGETDSVLENEPDELDVEAAAVAVTVAEEGAGPEPVGEVAEVLAETRRLHAQQLVRSVMEAGADEVVLDQGLKQYAAAIAGELARAGRDPAWTPADASALAQLHQELGAVCMRFDRYAEAVRADRVAAEILVRLDAASAGRSAQLASRLATSYQALTVAAAMNEAKDEARLALGRAELFAARAGALGAEIDVKALKGLRERLGGARPVHDSDGSEDWPFDTDGVAGGIAVTATPGLLPTPAYAGPSTAGDPIAQDATPQSLFDLVPPLPAPGGAADLSRVPDPHFPYLPVWGDGDLELAQRLLAALPDGRDVGLLDAATAPLSFWPNGRLHRLHVQAPGDRAGRLYWMTGGEADGPGSAFLLCFAGADLDEIFSRTPPVIADAEGAADFLRFGLGFHGPLNLRPRLIEHLDALALMSPATAVKKSALEAHVRPLAPRPDGRSGWVSSATFLVPEEQALYHALVGVQASGRFWFELMDASDDEPDPARAAAQQADAEEGEAEDDVRAIARLPKPVDDPFAVCIVGPFIPDRFAKAETADVVDDAAPPSVVHDPAPLSPIGAEFRIDQDIWAANADVMRSRAAPARAEWLSGFRPVTGHASRAPPVLQAPIFEWSAAPIRAEPFGATIAMATHQGRPLWLEGWESLTPLLDFAALHACEPKQACALLSILIGLEPRGERAAQVLWPKAEDAGSPSAEREDDGWRVEVTVSCGGEVQRETWRLTPESIAFVERSPASPGAEAQPARLWRDGVRVPA